MDLRRREARFRSASRADLTGSPRRRRGSCGACRGATTRSYGQRPVQHAAVVPDDQVADLPLVAVDALRRGRPLEQVVEQRPTLVDGPCPRRATSVAPSTSERRPTDGARPAGAPSAGACATSPAPRATGRGSRAVARPRTSATTRTCSTRAFSSSDELVVRGVGAGELGLAAGRGDRVRAQHRRHDRDVVGRAVDVPVERPPQVLRDRVLGRVERDPEDLGGLALPTPRPGRASG